MALRSWLIVLAAMMLFNAYVAVPILLDGWPRPIPFIITAGAAVVWAAGVNSGRATVVCSAFITVGVALRGVEVLLFADQFEMRARWTGMSIWALVSATSFVFGFLNLVAISRRAANELVEVGL